MKDINIIIRSGSFMKSLSKQLECQNVTPSSIYVSKRGIDSMHVLGHDTRSNHHNHNHKHRIMHSTLVTWSSSRLIAFSGSHIIILFGSIHISLF